MGKAKSSLTRKAEGVPVPQSGLQYTSTQMASMIEPAVTSQLVSQWARTYNMGRWLGNQRIFDDVDLMAFLQRPGKGRPTKEEMVAAAERLAKLND